MGSNRNFWLPMVVACLLSGLVMAPAQALDAPTASRSAVGSATREPGDHPADQARWYGTVTEELQGADSVTFDGGGHASYDWGFRAVVTAKKSSPRSWPAITHGEVEAEYWDNIVDTYPTCTWQRLGSGTTTEGSGASIQSLVVDESPLTFRVDSGAWQVDVDYTEAGCDRWSGTWSACCTIGDPQDFGEGFGVELQPVRDAQGGGWALSGSREMTTTQPSASNWRETRTWTVDLRCDDPCLDPSSEPTLDPDFDTDASVGNSNAVAFTGKGGTKDSARYEWDFGDGSATVSGRKPTHDFGAPGEYPVTMTVRQGGVREQETKDVVANPVVLYAPTVGLHPDEDRFPYAPGAFIKHSKLKWSNDRACRDDTLDKTPSASAMGKGRYEHRRANDLTCRETGKDYRSNQLTAPRDERSVLPDGEKLEGMYLDLDNDYYDGTSDLDSVPMFFEYKDDRYVTYWIFYAFNHWTGSKGVPLVERHEGDWEHITVRLDQDNAAKKVAYYQHYCQPEIKTWEEMEVGFGPGTGLDEDTHPLVFPALGGHASYWKPGNWVAGEGETACGSGEMVEDDTAAGGDQWRAWSGKGLKDARSEPWYKYGGLWGKVGAAKKLYSSGILGPSRWKFNDPKVPVVPGAWQ